MLTNERKEEIKRVLVAKAPNLTCPMCGSKGFSLADGYLMNTIQTDLKSIALGGQAIPSVGVICNNCGFISQHALGALDLLPKETKFNNDESK